MNILAELNKLNKVFYTNHVDVTQIGANLNIYTTILYRRFITIGVPAFGRGSKFLWPFLKAFSASQEMLFPIPNGTQKIHVHHEDVIYGCLDTIEECRIIGAKYV